MKNSKLFSSVYATIIQYVLAGLGGSGAAWLAVQAGEAADSVPPAMTLAYHLSTNAVGRAVGHAGDYGDMVELDSPYSVWQRNCDRAEWSKKFWLHGVHGLSATPVGFSNVLNGQGLPTMISPRHYLCATHMHPEGYLIAFLDTNNVIHWRKTLQRVDAGDDNSVGLLDADLPPSVGFLPVLPDNFTNYLPATVTNIIQGIGMNQDMCLFGEPMTFGNGHFVSWDSRKSASFGLVTNWNVAIRGGDSSNPAMLLVGDQLVLVSHNYFANGGPNYARQISAINQGMHLLSTNHHLRTDYQLTEFPLTNWPVIR